MANTPKSKDVSESALSAVEQALRNTESHGVPRPPAAAQPADVNVRRAGTQTPSPVVGDLFPEDARPPGWDETAPVRRAANDDRAAMGAILQALQGRPRRLPYAIATLFAVFWLGGGLGIAYLYKDALPNLLGQSAANTLALAGIGVAFLIPIILSFVLAHLIARSRDLRLVAQSMAEVAMRMTEPETNARESIVSVGQAVRREVAAMGDGVERALARAGELEALVHNEVSALERSYNDNEVRIRGLLTELANQRDTLVAQAEQVRNAISSVHLDLTHDITSVGDLVSEKVNDVAQRITRTLTEKGEHITLALGHAGDSMVDALGERGSNLLDRLETTSENATGAISNASDRLTASLNFKTDNVQEEFSQLAVRLQQMMTARLDQVTQGFAQKSAAVIEQMAGQSQQLTSAIVDTSSRMADNIVVRVEEVNSTLRSTGDSLVLDLSLRGGDVVSKMEQTGSRITDTIVARGNKVADTFRDSAEALVDAINTHGDSVKGMLVSRLQAFEEMFTHGGAELTEKISRDSTTLGSLITRHITEFDRTVKTYGGELVERLGQRTQDLSDSMRNYVDNFDSRVGAKTDEINSSLDQRLSQFESVLGTRVNDIATTLAGGGKDIVAALDKRISDVSNVITQRGTEVADEIGVKIQQIDHTLGSRATEVANNLDTRIGRFEELLIGRAETVTTQIELRSKAAADALNARMEQLSQSIKTNAGEAERSLGQLALTTTDSIRTSASEVERSLNALSTSVSSVLKENASDVERTMLGVSAEVARSFVGKADEISSEVSRRANEMTAILSDKSSGVLAALSGKSQEFAVEVTRATDEAVKSIENKGLVFTRTMLDNSEEIARIINKASETATSTVTNRLNELQATAASAIEQSKATAAATVSEMLETHGMLRSDTTALFERLREANIMLQEVLSGAHENMGALEHTMMTRVTEFVTAMDNVIKSNGAASSKMEENISGFREVTTTAVTELAALAAQFDVHGRDLTAAANLVERSNERTEGAINERRVALDSLITTLDIRTEDLDQRLKRFSGLLDESLEVASNRARDISRVVSEAGQAGAQSLGEQFERIRSTSEEERKRTNDALRNTFEQAATDTHSLFREASERFTDIMQGMKNMSSEMQRELDVTRAELRRGILELPQETAESAAQMRRVIVDQIEALAELNRIVARHGRNLDAVEPIRRSPREEPSLAVVGGREPPRGYNTRGDAGGFAPAPRRPEAPSLSPAAPQGGSRGGWLTDLLNRASRDEGEPPAREMPREMPRDIPREAPRAAPPRGDERPTRHSIESLDSLSVDIARMIDHEAAADLWDRYKRGERNVFTRRLYTLQGQKAFDEIQQKYRADREFKQTVDRYIGEFERLLDEVSRDDRGQVVTRTYLTSETGKVYTMLAHAAGRLN